VHPADEPRPPVNGSIPDDEPEMIPFYGLVSIPPDVLWSEDDEPLEEMLKSEIESMATALVNNVFEARAAGRPE
jgi:hypothetical protein